MKGFFKPLIIPIALLLFVVISFISQAIAFTGTEKTVMMLAAFLLIGAFIVAAAR